MIEVRHVTPDAIDALIPRLRPVDRLELDCMMPGDQRVGLLRMAERARRAKAAYIDGEIAGIFGVSAQGVLSSTGCPWMLATPIIEQRDVRRAFVECSPVALEWLGQDFTRLWNMVSVENRAAIRWLGWLGFEFGKVITVSGQPFRYFWKELHHVR